MSELVQRTVNHARELAHNMGLVAFFPHDTELFLDLDGPIDDGRIVKIIDCLAMNGITIVSRLDTVSKNRGKHVYLILSEPFEFLQRLVLQSVLGSDGVKEVLSMLRAVDRQSEQSAIALFETPDEASRVREHRISNNLEPITDYEEELP